MSVTAIPLRVEPINFDSIPSLGDTFPAFGHTWTVTSWGLGMDEVEFGVRGVSDDGARAADGLIKLPADKPWLSGTLQWVPIS